MSDNEKAYDVCIVKLAEPRKDHAKVVSAAYVGSGCYENCMEKVNEIRNYSEYVDAKIVNNKTLENVVPFLFKY